MEVIDAGFGVPFFIEDVFGEADLGGVAAGVGDVEDLDHLGKVEAGALGHAPALDGGHEAGVANHVVDEFEGMARAGGAEVKDFVGEGFEIAAGPREGGFVAAEHEGEGAGGGSGCAAAHPGVEVVNAEFGGAAGEALCIGGVGGGEVVEGEAAGAASPGIDGSITGASEDAGFALQRFVDLGRGGDDEDDGGAGQRHLAGGDRCDVFHAGKRFHGARGGVPNREGKAGGGEVMGDAAPHVAKSDDADLGFWFRYWLGFRFGYWPGFRLGFWRGS